VRISLGASRAEIVRRSMARTMRLALAGGTTGLLGAVALSRILSATLYETSPLDPAVYGGATAVLMVAVAAASYFPLRRALRVDPVDVLRSE
jgi:putative ABC transport system permease protein